MSSGGGYNGGRTRMGTVVILNVYDLTPANDFLSPIGMGLNHSGVEIMGSEYSFASGGGIFPSNPREAPGARFRESLNLGTFEGGSAEVRKAIDELRNDFRPDSYNLLARNCNHFADALVYTLLKKTIPPYVNRLADLGNYFSCLLPKSLLEAAPVGDGGGSSTSGYQVHSAGSRTAVSSSTSAFAGAGMALGSSSPSQSSNVGGGGVLNGGFRSFLGGTSNGVPSASSGRDELTDRREKARKAAMSRFEENKDK